jgi:site-specific DNA-methyltransferase (adenine-specific)
MGLTSRTPETGALAADRASVPENQIIEGDCAQVLKTIPDASVDFVLTDPPYGVQYRERNGRTVAGDSDLTEILGCFADVYRVLKADSVCISFYGWTQVDTFFQAWRTAGFRPVGHLVWHKPYASRKGYLQGRHEQAYVLAKGKPPQPGEPLEDVRPWEYTGNRAHPTEKAVGILKPLIRSFSRPGDLVLDPFSGSGSTAAAALLSGRRYLGIELDAGYCRYARKRLAGAARYLAGNADTGRPS